jgi:hypothetical protein
MQVYTVSKHEAENNNFVKLLTQHFIKYTFKTDEYGWNLENQQNSVISTSKKYNILLYTLQTGRDIH